MLSALIFIAVSVSSCREEGLLGLEVQPPADRVNALLIDTFSVISTTVREDSVRSDEPSVALLGSYVDPVFGEAPASFYTEFNLPVSNLSFGNPQAITIDSMVLALDFTGYYGKTNPQNIQVFELTEALSANPLYYSNQAFSYDPSVVGALTDYTPGSDMRIHLNTSWARKFIDAPTSAFANDSTFQNLFKGFYVRTSSSGQLAGEGAIVYFNLLSAISKLTLYYRNATEKLAQDFIINEASARINHFTHDYTGTPVASQLQNPALGQEVVYIQSMAGTNAKIFFLGLEDFINQNKNRILINKAEVILPVDENGINEYLPHDRLVLYQADSAGQEDFVLDQFEGQAYFGGIYNNDKKEYRFNIARHISRLSINNLPDYGFYIEPAVAAVTANRTILKGGSNTSGKIKLLITYTKL